LRAWISSAAIAIAISAGLAVTALRHFFLDPCLLHCMRVITGKAFDGSEFEAIAQDPEQTGCYMF